MKSLSLSFVFTVIALVSFGQDSLSVTSYNGDIDTLYAHEKNNGFTEFQFTSGCFNNYCLDTIKIDIYEDTINVSDTLINFEDTVFIHFLNGNNFDICLLDSNADFVECNEYDTTAIKTIKFGSIEELINLDSVGSYNIIFDYNGYNSYNVEKELRIHFVIELYSSENASVEEEVQKVRNTKVYPNPVVDQMTIDFETDETNMPVEVYSTNGQKVYSNNESRMFGTNTVKVNMSNKPRGMYYVKIGGEVKKVVK